MVGNGGSGWRRMVAIAATSCVVLVVLIEVGLRVLPIPGLGRSDLVPELEKILAQSPFDGHPYLAFRPKPGWSSPDGKRTHNAWGFRGPSVTMAKPAGVYRIVCLGGSSTYGHGPSSDATTWPARLQARLNDPAAGSGKRVEVLNGGFSGWSTFESIGNLAFRMVDFEPDLVVVYHTINDMRCALYERGGPVTSDNLQWRSIWPRILAPPGERALETSRTYLLARRLFTDYTKAVDTLANYAIVNYDPDDPDPFERETPDERGFQSFRRNLITIQAIAKAHGADVMFVTQGCDDRDIKARSRDNQLAGMARMTQTLKDVAAERDLHLLDAKTRMEAIAVEDGIDRYFTNEVHLTDDGADLLSRLVAEEVMRLGIVR